MTTRVEFDASSWPPSLREAKSGLLLVTGPNGGGKSSHVAAWAAALRGAVVSAESEQAFYERELRDDEANFQGGVATGRTVRDVVGPRGEAHPLYRILRLDELSERLFRRLSSGEARKVLLLSALVDDPDLLVVDEPFGALDQAAQDDLWRVLRDISERHLVVVVEAAPGDRLARYALVAFFAHGFRWCASGDEAVARWSAEFDTPLRSPPVAGEAEAWPREIPLVELRNGRVAYGDVDVWRDLDWTLRAGEHTLVSGPNGSGKSTLLQFVTGDHPQAYANELFLFGRRRGSGESIWEIKSRIGVVSGQLHRDYRAPASVLEVIASGFTDSIGLYESLAPRQLARARAWLGWLELGVSEDRAFRELSFGEQRFVLFARAMVKEPPLVVLDEPTTGLDEGHRCRALDYVASLTTQSRATVLLVSHRAEERRFWQERIGGRELILGAPKQSDEAGK